MVSDAAHVAQPITPDGTAHVETPIQDTQEGGHHSLPVQDEDQEGEEDKVELKSVGGDHLNQSSLAAIEAAKVHDERGYVPQHAATRQHQEEIQDGLHRCHVKLHDAAPYLAIVQDDRHKDNHIERENGASNSNHLKGDGHGLLTPIKVSDAEGTLDPTAPSDLRLGNDQPEGSHNEGKHDNKCQTNVHLPDVRSEDVSLEADVEGNGTEGKQEVIRGDGTGIAQPQNHPFPTKLTPP